MLEQRLAQLDYGLRAQMFRGGYGIPFPGQRLEHPGYTSEPALVYLDISPDKKLIKPVSSVTKPSDWLHIESEGEIPLVYVIEGALRIALEYDADVVYITPHLPRKGFRILRTMESAQINPEVRSGVDIRTIDPYVYGSVLFAVDHPRRQRSSIPRGDKIITPPRL